MPGPKPCWNKGNGKGKGDVRLAKGKGKGNGQGIGKSLVKGKGKGNGKTSLFPQDSGAGDISVSEKIHRPVQIRLCHQGRILRCSHKLHGLQQQGPEDPMVENE